MLGCSFVLFGAVRIAMECYLHKKFYVDSKYDCRPILHKYANEDVSLGAWFIGLEVEHIDDRSMCCGTPPGI